MSELAKLGLCNIVKLVSAMQWCLLVHGRCLKYVCAISNLCFQAAMVVGKLGIDTIMNQTSLLLPLDVVISGILGETPVSI